MCARVLAKFQPAREGGSEKKVGDDVALDVRPGRRILVVLLIGLMLAAFATTAAFAKHHHRGNQKVANSQTATQVAPAIATSGNATAERCEYCEAANGAAVQNNPNQQNAQSNGGAARNGSSANGGTINQENNQVPTFDFDVEAD